MLLRYKMIRIPITMDTRSRRDSDIARYNCCVDAAMEVIEGRWKGTILCMLYRYGSMRYSEIQHRIADVSSRILSKQLKELESDGMIARHVDASGKVKVTYSLTDKGLSIIPMLASLAEWAAKNHMVQIITPESISEEKQLPAV